MRSWYVADGTDQVLGRLASHVATVLRGKHKPTYTPHVDGGDFVVVVNAKNVRLTGRKAEQKEYVRHSGHKGGLRSVTAGRLLETHPDRVLRAAVKGMLPKGPLGRRMLTTARVFIRLGTGDVKINKRTPEDYFPREILRMHFLEPLRTVEHMGNFDMYITVRGGGDAGQAGAIRHGIARALQKYDPTLRPALKKAGLLTRDAREKERKKYGQKGARARFQYSKR